jgi:hypothetical protein
LKGEDDEEVVNFDVGSWIGFCGERAPYIHGQWFAAAG